MWASFAIVRQWVKAVAEVTRRVAGMPDYERFVAHLRAEHPGCQIPSRQSYFADYVKGRYDRPGTRCC